LQRLTRVAQTGPLRTAGMNDFGRKFAAEPRNKLLQIVALKAYVKIFQQSSNHVRVENLVHTYSPELILIVRVEICDCLVSKCLKEL